MYLCVCELLRCIQFSVTPWTLACQAPLSMGFSMQEYWGGLPFPSPGDLPNPGIKPRSPALQTEPPPSNKNIGRMVLGLCGAQSISPHVPVPGWEMLLPLFLLSAASLPPRDSFPKLQSFMCCFTRLSKSSLLAHYFSFSPLASYFSTFSA